VTLSEVRNSVTHSDAWKKALKLTASSSTGECRNLSEQLMEELSLGNPPIKSRMVRCSPENVGTHFYVAIDEERAQGIVVDLTAGQLIYGNPDIPNIPLIGTVSSIKHEIKSHADRYGGRVMSAPWKTDFAQKNDFGRSL
jgi:hypothetical protein